jgi:translation initiation factor eIF-2B subunit delta
MTDNESAPVAQAQASQAPEPQPTESQTLPIRESKPKPTEKDAPASADGAAEKPLTPGELKKKAKAEKAARRAREKLEKDGGAPSSAAPGPGAGQARPPATPKKDTATAAQKGQKTPTARRGSVALAQSGSALVEQKKKRDDKKVAVFGHLYGQQRRTTIAGGAKEVHPAVLALGLQLRDYVVCGSSARCVSTMIAFKRVCLVPPMAALFTNPARSLNHTPPL